MGDPVLSFDEVLIALRSVKKSGANYLAQCPAHDDRMASLSVTRGESGRILFKCFAGCTYDQIIHALGFSSKQLQPPKLDTGRPTLIATYDYRDAAGAICYQVCRLSPKTFRQRRPDGAGGWIWNMRGVVRVPYRLNECKAQSTVYVVEGEKDADALWTIGIPATTNVGGASKWRDSDSDALKHVGVARAVLLPDNDDPGREHMRRVAQSLKAVGIAIVYLPLPDVKPKGDVSDWLRVGHTKHDLETLVASKPYVLPKGGSPDDADLSGDADPKGAGRWARTDLGAAEALADRFGHQLKWDHQRERWLVWNCHHWRPDSTKAVQRLAHEHIRAWQSEACYIRDKDDKDKYQDFARGLESRGKFENMLKFTKELTAVASDGSEWDRDPWLLGCPNGVVDLRTGEFRPGAPADRVTLQVETPYQDDANAPAWTRFVDEVFDGDKQIVRYVQRALGYSLTGLTTEQCFFMCVGKGSNGKSTFLSTIENVWGSYAYTTSMATFTVNGPYGSDDFNLAELDGPRLILASETKAESRINEQLIKNFTGGEKINAQRKHGHPFVYRPVGKIWVGLNQQPTVKDESHGFWRRVRLLNFPRTFAGSQADLHLSDNLRAEAPGILAWAVRGCLTWQRDGFETPLPVLQAVDEYKDSEDPLREFIAECLIVDDPNAEESIGTLYESFCNFQQKLGTQTRYVPSRKSFGRSLSGRFDKRESNGRTLYRGVTVKFRAQERLYDSS